MLSTDSIQEETSQHNWKIVDWDVKNKKMTYDIMSDVTSSIHPKDI